MSELLKGEIDAVINVLDVNNLERNLLLTLQVRRLGLPTVGALNLWDEFAESGSSLDVERLSAHMGMRFVPCVASRGEGLQALAEAVIEAYAHREEPTPTRWYTTTWPTSTASTRGKPSASPRGSTAFW